MDEETEKPFPIEFIVILLIIALANDLAEIFFDLLDFTGIGVAGEAIMEPIDFVLDLFFTSIFVWKVGFGGGTITQYLDDLLEPFFIPGRTLSVGLGMWIANHPNSIVSKAATTAAALEGGNVDGALGKAEGEIQGAANSIEKDVSSAKKELPDEGKNGPAKYGDPARPEEAGGNPEREAEGKDDKAQKDPMADINEGDPIENLQRQELEEPIGEDSKITEGDDAATATREVGKQAGGAIKEVGRETGEVIKKGSEAAGEGVKKAGEAAGEIPYIGPVIQGGAEVAGGGIKVAGKVAGEVVKQGSAIAGKGVAAASTGASNAVKKVVDIKDPEEDLDKAA